MIERRAGLLALLLAAGYFALLWATGPSYGVTRDESYYFKAAEEYGRWWEVLCSSRFFDAFKDEEIKRHFSYNTEHPALVKLTLGLGYRLFHDLLGVAGPTQAYRATGFLFGALTVFATFLLGRKLVGARVGLLAAGLIIALPRFFYDAHLACFDVPITAMWTLSLWAFWRAFEGGASSRRRSALFAGVIFGLALATKLNALFLPPLFVLIWLFRERALSTFGWIRGPSGSRDLRLPAIPLVLLACAVVGPIVFYLHWPYLWHAPFERTGAYIAFHFNHEHYPISYFHQLLVKPPFPVPFPFVMSFVTLPSPLLFLGTAGLGVALVRIAKNRSAEEVLLVSSVLLPILLLATTTTPIFGGVKHWYNAMPALAILAARAIWEGIDALVERLPAIARPVAALSTVALALVPGALGIAASHPYGIGFYNELAGGPRGGAELGMQRGFWGGLADELFPRMADLPAGSNVFFNRSTYDAWRMHRRERRIPETVYYANDAKGAVAGALHFEQPEHGEREGEIWSSVGTRPIAGVYVDNVLLTQIYLRGLSSSPPP